jgi:uncharacterized protein YkwD
MQDAGGICLGPLTSVGYRAVSGGKTRLRVLAALVGALVFTVSSPFPKANALTSDEGSLLSSTNASRAQYGKGKLTLSSDLVSVARKHSAEMAAKGAIFHNSSLGSDVNNWRKVGENVGRGPSAKSVHQAFMGSSSHRTHILDGAYDRVGVGTVWKGSTLYVTVIFVDSFGSTPAPKPKPKYVAKKYVPVHVPAKPKPKPKLKPPPPVAAPMTLGLLLELLAMDAQSSLGPMPAPDTQPVP